MDASQIIAFITLVIMEIALGVDNVIFVSILSSKLPLADQAKARRIWMIAGIIMRVALLWILTIALSRLNTPLHDPFTLGGTEFAFTGKRIILLVGGLFLIYKSVKEIHEKLEGEEVMEETAVRQSFNGVILQIIIVDLVFSIDSIITAIGIAEEIWLMAPAVILAMIGMFAFAKPLNDIVVRRPTLKMLALCFLLLIGVLLVAEGAGRHIPKGYIYFAMGFSILVELLNTRVRKESTKPVQLKVPHLREKDATGAGQLG